MDFNIIQPGDGRPVAGALNRSCRTLIAPLCLNEAL